MTYVQPELPGMPEEQVTEVELDGVGRDLVRELNVCDDAIGKWGERRQVAYDQLLKLITGGDETPGHYAGTFDGVSVVHATVYRERRFNSRAFQSDHPVLYESYRQDAIRKRVTPDRTVK